MTIQLRFRPVAPDADEYSDNIIQFPADGTADTPGANTYGILQYRESPHESWVDVEVEYD